MRTSARIGSLRAVACDGSWPLLAVRSRRTPEDDDPTNAKRHLLVPDAEIHNNGPLEDVDDLAADVWRDLCRGELAEVYGEP